MTRVGTLSSTFQEAVDEEYKSEVEEEDQFDSDFNDSEVGGRVKLLF